MAYARFSRQPDGTYNVISADTREVQVHARGLSLEAAASWVRDLNSGVKKRGK